MGTDHTIEILAENLERHVALALHGDNVYWVDADDGKVMQLAKTGGTPVVLASDQKDPMGIAVDGSGIYWSNHKSGEASIATLSHQQALNGDVDRLVHSISTEEEHLRCERISDEIVRVSFADGRNLSADLPKLLETVSRHDVDILSVRTAGEIEDAFLKHLEVDRVRCFSRAYEAPKLDSTSDYEPTDTQDPR